MGASEKFSKLRFWPCLTSNLCAHFVAIR